ncbi:MAG: tungstate ABC transporter substrate-binding protein WtpA [Planctomycetota bacterium]|nr:MAG: tungstate ABC transporter substrate-binding protein WtpA [Planctomycetota bacterium]
MKDIQQRFLREVVLSLVIIVSFFGGCQHDEDGDSEDGELSGRLVIFHAGSLAVPFQDLADEFKLLHPKVKVFIEMAGSRECARKVSDLGKSCDVIALADSKVIANLLMPKYADWYIEFANNEMVLVYSREKMGELTVENVVGKLLQTESMYRADPDLDPCGYRTLMVWQLMERYYKHPGLYKKLWKICPPSQTRPKETDILALFEISQVDCFFIYRSVAQQHHLNYLKLPDDVNLSQPDLKDTYVHAQVEVSGKQPGKTIVRIGEPIVYGLTVPKIAEEANLGREFVRFVLSENGKAIMKKNGQGTLARVFPKGYKDAKELLSQR